MDNEDISKHHCTSCMNQARDILIVCEICSDFELCLQCYVYGTEIGEHKRDHEVQMIDLGTFPLFMKKNKNKMESDDSDKSAADEQYEKFKKDEKEFERFLNEDLGKEFFMNHVVKETQTNLPAKIDENGDDEYEWRAMDEKALFEALTRVGYGNWKEIANYMNPALGTNISPAEIERHYNEYYINGLIGRLSWALMFTDPVVRQLSRFPFTVRGMQEDKIFPEKDNCMNLFRDIPQTELVELGYLPKRDDFEREFDNEAETLISNLTLGAENEDDIEKKFKLTQVDIYQRRLISRFRKKLIIRVNELIKLFLEVHKNEFFKDTLQNRRDSNSKLFKDFEEKYPMFMPFVRYLRRQDLNSLFNDLAMEQVLKILLKKMIMFQVLSANNLDTLKKEDKIKMLQVFDKALDKKIEEENGQNNEKIKTETTSNNNNNSNNSIIDNSTKASSSKSSTTTTFKNDSSIDVEDLEDMDEQDIMDMIFADENPIDRDCLNQLINHESIQSLSHLTAEFLKKLDNEELLREAFKFFDQQEQYWKEESSILNQASTSESESMNAANSSPKKKLKSDTDTAMMETESSITNTLTEMEKKLCNELKLDATLFIGMKNVLIKQHKKYPKASRHRLNFENIMNKNFYGREHLETLRRIHNHLIAHGELSTSATNSTMAASSSNSSQTN